MPVYNPYAKHNSDHRKKYIVYSAQVKNRTEDMTRGTVQKSVVVLSRLPLYGQIQVWTLLRSFLIIANIGIVTDKLLIEIGNLYRWKYSK